MLTTKQAEAARLTGDRYALPDGKVDGLALRVGSTCQAKGCPGGPPCPAHAKHGARALRGDHGPVKTWTLLYYFAGQRRRINLGRWPAVGVDKARRDAHDMLARVRKGEDPEAAKVRARETPTLAAAVELYLVAIAGTKATRTIATNRQRLRTYAVPAFGRRLVTDIKLADVRALHAKITREGHDTTANRVVEVLRSFYAWARVEWPDVVVANPARFEGFERNAESPRDRTIDDVERTKLLQAIAAGELLPARREGAIAPTHANACRLALVAGFRPVDLCTLRHEYITRQVAAGGRKIWIATWPAKARTKKANQRRVLNSAAIAIIEAQHAITGGAGYVFPNERGGQLTSSKLAAVFRRVRAAAGITDAEVTLYTAGRHTYVTDGVIAGIPLAVMGADVDNAHAVQRYAHLQRAVDDGVSERVLASRGAR